MQPELASTLSTTHALKEWAVAIEALRDGESVLTLRKGGIREDAREFRMEHKRFVLFPTYEHQNHEQLRDEFAERLDLTLRSAPEQGYTRLNTWAVVSDVLEVTHEEQVQALSRFAVFSPAYAIERLKWRPRKPLHILVLRVFLLDPPVTLPIVASYGGCRSWIELAQDIALSDTRPALADVAFQERRTSVLQSLRNVTPTGALSVVGL